MSTRSLRKSTSRAAARVNYDETVADQSEEDAQKSVRKRSTRASTRLSEVVPPQEEEDEPVAIPSEREPTPDDVDAPDVAVGPSASTSQSGSTSDDPTSASQGVDSRPGARRVRLRLSKSNKLPATPAEDEEEEEEDASNGEEESEVGAESDDQNEEEEEEEDETGTPAEVLTGRAAASMTARQAALAGLSSSDVRHLSLDEVDNSRKKGPIKTEEELAAKRREAAKRRKLQMEQKVKEEKEGAVDRLLNKQAPRPRAKRNASGILVPVVSTPSGYNTPTRGPRAGDIIEPDTRSTSPDEDEESSDGYVPPPYVATTLRWTSSSRAPGYDGLITEVSSEGNMETDVDTNPNDAEHSKGGEIKSGPTPGNPNPPETEPAVSFSLNIPSAFVKQLMPEGGAVGPRPKATPICAIAGCKAPRKYRIPLPSGEKGVCGLEHYKMVKAG